jgi:hypothetical protein
MNYPSLDSSSYNISCNEIRNTSYEINGTCPNGYLYTLSCPSNSKGSYNITCPGYKTIPQCTMFDNNNNSYVESSDCIVHDYNSYTTQCLCNLDSQIYLSNRHLLDSKSSNTQQQTTLSLSSSTKVIETKSFSSEYISVDKYNNFEVQIIYNSVILIMMLIILGLSMLSLLPSLSLFRKDKKDDQDSFYAISDDNSNDNNNVMNSSTLISTKYRTIHRFFEDLLPIEFRTDAWYSIVAWRLRHQHLFFSLFVSLYDHDKCSYKRLKVMKDTMINLSNNRVKWVLVCLQWIVYIFINCLVTYLIDRKSVV